MILIHADNLQGWTEHVREAGLSMVILVGPRWNEGYCVTAEQWESILALVGAPEIER